MPRPDFFPKPKPTIAFLDVLGITIAILGIPGVTAEVKEFVTCLTEEKDASASAEAAHEGSSPATAKVVDISEKMKKEKASLLDADCYIVLYNPEKEASHHLSLQLAQIRGNPVIIAAHSLKEDKPKLGGGFFVCTSLLAKEHNAEIYVTSLHENSMSFYNKWITTHYGSSPIEALNALISRVIIEPKIEPMEIDTCRPR